MRSNRCHLLPAQQSHNGYLVGAQCLLLQRNVTAIERLAQTPFRAELLMARDTTTWQTALQLACSPGASEVVQVLLQASADVSAREPSRSWTALHVAADRGCDVPTLQMLLEVVLPLVTRLCLCSLVAEDPIQSQ